MHSTVVCFVSCSLFGYFSIIRFQRSPIFCALQCSNEWELSLANVGIIAHYRRILIKHVSRNLSHYNQLWYCWSCSPSFFSLSLFFFVFFISFTYFYRRTTGACFHFLSIGSVLCRCQRKQQCRVIYDRIAVLAAWIFTTYCINRHKVATTIGINRICFIYISAELITVKYYGV